MEEESWLDPEALEDEWIDVIDGEGENLGYLLRSEANRMSMVPQVIETPERFLTDPWVLHHAILMYERGLLSGAKDLNDVQLVMLSSHIMRKREFEKKDRERIFEERFFTANPEGYKAWKEQEARKEEMDGDVEGIEQRVPGSVEEFLAHLAALGGEEGESQDKGRERAEGWLASILDDSELEQMEED